MEKIINNVAEWDAFVWLCFGGICIVLFIMYAMYKSLSDPSVDQYEFSEEELAVVASFAKDKTVSDAMRQICHRIVMTKKFCYHYEILICMYVGDFKHLDGQEHRVLAEFLGMSQVDMYKIYDIRVSR